MTESRRMYSNLQALEWLVQLASALAHLHGNWPPIIHRDIKHENVLLKRVEPGRAAAGPSAAAGRGGGRGQLEAKLADLGLHVMVEPDRSVMLRRKSHYGGANRSVHSRPVSQASGLTLPSGPGGAGGAGGGGAGSPFMTVTMGHSGALSAAPSPPVSAPLASGPGAGLSRVGPRPSDSGSSDAGGSGGGDDGGDLIVYDIHGALAAREVSESYLTRELYTDAAAQGPEPLRPGGGGAGGGGDERAAPLLESWASRGQLPAAPASGAAGWSGNSGVSSSAGGAEEACDHGTSASSINASISDRTPSRAPSNKVLPHPLRPEEPARGTRGEPVSAATAAAAAAAGVAAAKASPARVDAAPGAPPRSGSPPLRPATPPPATAAAAAAAPQPPPQPLGTATSFAHNFPPGAIPYAPSMPRAGTSPGVAAPPRPTSSQPGSGSPQSPEGQELVWAASLHPAAAEPRRSMNGNSLAARSRGGDSAGGCGASAGGGRGEEGGAGLAGEAEGGRPRARSGQLTSGPPHRVSHTGVPAAAPAAPPSGAQWTSFAGFQPAGDSAAPPQPPREPPAACSEASPRAAAADVSARSRRQVAIFALPEEERLKPASAPPTATIQKLRGGSGQGADRPASATGAAPAGNAPAAPPSPFADAAADSLWSESPARSSPSAPVARVAGTPQRPLGDAGGGGPAAAERQLETRRHPGQGQQGAQQQGQPEPGRGQDEQGGTMAAAVEGRREPETLEPVESIGAILTRNPHLMQPLALDAAASAPAAGPSGLRRVRSLLQQFRAMELRHLRHASVEWVFGLTGRAGSCMYMAPEVFRKLPYNEKADVFSFGVLSYELLARELLLVSYFNTSKGAKLGLHKPEDYAEMVCQGYRPPRPTCLSDGVWALVEECWHDDPVRRPPMAEVLRRLEALRDEEAAHPSDPRGALPGCAAGCTLQ